MITFKINEYKYIFNDSIRVQKEYDEGSADLNFRLSFFQEKVIKTNNQDLIERFNKQLGKYVPQPADHAQVNNEDSKSNDNKDIFPVKEKDDSPKWVKKLYRQIAKETHPDKYSTGTPEMVRALMKEFFTIASTAYEEKEYADLLMVANDLKFVIDPSEEKLMIIKNAIAGKKQKMKTNMSSLAYQWYHIGEKDKSKYFKTILNSLGFSYTQEEIDTVVKKKRPVNNPRKKGERPGKGVLNRRK
jgi:hypothetical protein